MSLCKHHIINGQHGSKLKYFGKWPFQRILGMQELLSVVFSVANLAVHAHNVCKLRKRCRSAAPATQPYVLLTLWIVYAVGSVNAWWWSAVFHARDTYVTERFDYLSADVSILLGLYVSLVRTLGLKSMRSRFSLAILLLTAAGMHFYHMLKVKFDYGLNVMLCAAVGILQQLMWCIWALKQDHPQKQRLFLFVVLINGALCLEILDFPPVMGLLDAHALWHLCTIPLTYMWYAFAFADVEWAAQAEPQRTATGKCQ